MLTAVEPMQWIEQFGRWSMEEFVAESQDMRDVYHLSQGRGKLRTGRSYAICDHSLS
jgi:hypothetical protein